ncbi:hypothetical protein M0R04_10140 [Candidatus Dojkabacteria bacterium]|jgi:hypothetical protein|nr:hypothetical protein [Candidatus Dojkabacteria bacterium]
MNKQQKIEYIEKINARFIEARNHGGRNNWWYPTENTIAYDVKMHGACKSINEIREKMSKRQNDFYSDDALYQYCDELRERECESLIELIKETGKNGLKNAYFAGRMGGWVEVKYINDIQYYLDNEDIKSAYKEARELEQLESDVHEEIKKQHKAYSLYVNTDGYIVDVIDALQSDEDIGEIYKSRAKMLLEKLK